MSTTNRPTADEPIDDDGLDVAVDVTPDLDLSDVEDCAAMLADSVRGECEDDCEATPDVSAWLTSGSRGTRLSVKVQARCAECDVEHGLITGAPITATFDCEVCES